MVATFNYRREVDGLRAIALLSVILYHADFKIFSRGFLGVDVFFVISGYLITSKILHELENKEFSLGTFYERRARRILPALFVVVLSCIPFGWMWLDLNEMKDFSQSVGATSLFASNVLFLRESGYFEVSSDLKPLLHTWSLAVEEQYYLLFPLLLLAFRKASRRFLLVSFFILAVSSFFLWYRFSLTAPDVAFYLLPSRIWEFLFGSIVSVLGATIKQQRAPNWLSKGTGWIGAVLILYSVSNFNWMTTSIDLNPLFASGGTAFAIIGSRRSSIGKLLNNKLLVGIGLISYSAYLWHQPLFAFATYRSSGPPSPFLYAILILLTFGLGWLSWRFVERPFRQSFRVSKKRVLLISCLTSFLFLVFGGIGHLTDGFDFRFPQDFRDIANIKEIHNVSRGDGDCNLDTGQSRPLNCVRGADGQDPSIALFGDSHAASLANELEKALSHFGRSYVQFTKNGCPPTLTFNSLEDRNSCREFVQYVLTQLKKQNEISTVVIAARWSHYTNESSFDNSEGGVDPLDSNRYTALSVDFNSDFVDRRDAILYQYRESVRYLLDIGKRIVLIYPIPEQGWDVPTKMFAERKQFDRPVQNFGVQSQLVRLRNQQIIELFDSLPSSPRLLRIMPIDALCDTFLPTRCVASLNGSALYYDSNHLSNYGARIVVQEFEQFLK